MANPFKELADLIKIGKEVVPLGEADAAVREGLTEVAEKPKVRTLEEQPAAGGGGETPPPGETGAPAPRPEEPQPPQLDLERPGTRTDPLDDVTDLELEQTARAADQQRLGDQETNLNWEKINNGDDYVTLADEMARQSKARGDGPPPRTTLENIAIAAGRRPIDDLSDIIGDKAYARAEKILQPDQLVQMRNIWVTMADNLKKRGQDIMDRSGQVTDEELLKFRHDVARFRGLQEVIAGQTRFAGQLLNSFRIRSAPMTPLRSMEVTGSLDDMGGRDVAMKLAGDFANGNSVQKISDIASMGWAAKTLRFLDSYRYNSMLSAPETHGRNITGNLGSLAVRITEKPISAIAGAARQAVRGVDETAHSQDQRAYLRETVAEIGGLVYGTLEGVRLMWQGLKDPDFRIGTTRTAEVQFRPALLNTRWAAKSPITKAIAFMGDLMLLNGATRALNGMDHFFKGVMYQADASARAVRQGLAEGLEGDDLVERVTDLARTPRSDLYQRSLDEIERVTFTNRLTGGAASIQRTINQWPVLRLVVPFMRVIANLTRWSAQRSFPLNVPGAVRAFKEGGIEADQMVAKMMTGAMIGYYAYDQVAQGNLTGTGAFVSEKTRENWKRSGWQPGSVLNQKTGEYESITGLAPVSTVLLYYASMAEAFHFSEDELAVDDYMLGTISVFAEVTINQSFARGMYEWLRAVDDPGRYGSAPIKSLASTAVPNWARWIRRQMDPQVRDKYTGTFVGDVVASLKDKTPGLSDTLPPAVEWFGGDMTPGYSMFDMMPSTHAHKDWGLYAALIENGVRMQRDKPKLRVGGVEVDLFAMQDKRGEGWAYYEWKRIHGRKRKEFVREAMLDTGYENAPRGEAGTGTGGEVTRGDYLRRALTQARMAALEEMADKYGALETLVEAERAMRNEVLAPLPPHIRGAIERRKAGQPAFEVGEK